MRIVSYNIRKAVGLDRKRDPKRILDILREVNADIVVLQEADRRLGKRSAALPPEMIRGETDYRIVDHAGSDVSLGWHGNAILARDGLDVEAVDRLDLPGLEPRGAVVARCGELVVVGTHLGLLRSHRLQQMERIRKALANGQHQRALIAGDFNEWSEATGFEPWKDAFDVLRPGRSFRADLPLARLDGFATGNDVCVTSGAVHDTESARIASDHLPVWAEVARRRTELAADQPTGGSRAG